MNQSHVFRLVMESKTNSSWFRCALSQQQDIRHDLHRPLTHAFRDLLDDNAWRLIIL